MEMVDWMSYMQGFKTTYPIPGYASTSPHKIKKNPSVHFKFYSEQQRNKGFFNQFFQVQAFSFQCQNYYLRCMKCAAVLTST